jgi:hypothetical protein
MSTDLPLVAPRDSVESVTLQDFAASVTSHQGSTGTQAAHYIFIFCFSLSIFCSGNRQVQSIPNIQECSQPRPGTTLVLQWRQHSRLPIGCGLEQVESGNNFLK